MGFNGMSEAIERFAFLCERAEMRGIKLVLLTGTSPQKANFVEACSQRYPSLMRVNLGLELSKRLQDEPKDVLGISTNDYLQMVGGEQGVLLENTEILFDPGMGIDVLNTLKMAARSRLMCVDVRAGVSRLRGCLTYAPDDYLEHKILFDSEFIILDESGFTFPEKFIKK